VVGCVVLFVGWRVRFGGGFDNLVGIFWFINGVFV